jgi:hypothetical protein
VSYGGITKNSDGNECKVISNLPKEIFETHKNIGISGVQAEIRAENLPSKKQDKPTR